MPGARGETTIALADREVRILFTNRALADAEQALGRSILGVAQGMMDGTTGVTETVHLLRVGMNAARRDAGEPGPVVPLNRAYEVMDEAGFSAVMVAVMEAVSAVLSYGQGEETGPNPP